MAFCSVCGGWAGFFRYRHDGCKPLSVVPASAVPEVLPDRLPAPSIIPWGGVYHSGTRTAAVEPTRQTITASFTLRGTDESNYIQRLFPVTRAQYKNLTPSRRGRAFVIDGFKDATQVRQVRDALSVLLENGGTAADFRKWVNDLAVAFGVGAIDREIIDGTFERYARRAYGLTRRKQMELPAVMDALPYWQYVTVGDDKVGPVCASLDGFVAVNSDPVWTVIYPDGCRCAVVPVLEHQALALDPKAAADGYSRLPELARAHFYPAR